MKEFLKGRLKQLMAESLDLDDVDMAALDDDASLFDGEMGLDSIDALELVIQVEKVFGVKIKSSEETREALTSINVLADYILSRAPGRVAELQTVHS